MSPVRKKQVRRAILETLEMAKGYALESGTLEMHVNDLLRPPLTDDEWKDAINWLGPVSYTHLRAHETVLDLVCRLLLEKKKFF